MIASTRALLLGATVGAVLAGCGEKREPPVSPPAPGATGATGATGTSGEAPPGRPLQLGLSEANPQLLAPGSAAPGFGAFRDAVSRLRPDRYRLVVDWSKLQPEPARPADLALGQDGCLRGLPPCAQFAGVRATLQAVREARRAAGGGWEVMVVIYGVPDWAAAGAQGCERPGAKPRSRAISDTGLEGYRALIRRLLALGEEVGVPLDWWSPWNEPNHPAFISPQRAGCAVDSPSLAPAVYGRLVRTAAGALKGSGAKLVLGELAGFRAPRALSTGVAEFIRALPDEVACAAGAWSQHEYASPADEPVAPFARDAVGEAEAALAARPCTAKLPLWVTETGVGGERPGDPRPTGARALARQCAAQAARLERWAAAPRIDAVFQYTFREDTGYPVGLADARLQALYPTQRLWQDWADARGGAPPPRPAGCGAP